MAYRKDVVKYFEEGYKGGFTIDRLSGELLKAGFDRDTVNHSINKFLQKRNTKRKLGFKKLSKLQIGLIIAGVVVVASVLLWVFL